MRLMHIRGIKILEGCPGVARAEGKGRGSRRVRCNNVGGLPRGYALYATGRTLKFLHTYV